LPGWLDGALLGWVLESFPGWVDGGPLGWVVFGFPGWVDDGVSLGVGDGCSVSPFVGVVVSEAQKALIFP
jgi:hypothetical protein